MIREILKNNDLNNIILSKYFYSKTGLQTFANRLNSLYENRGIKPKRLDDYELALLENELQILLSKNIFDGNTIFNSTTFSLVKEFFSKNYLYHVNSYLCSPIYNEEKYLEKLFDNQARVFIGEQKKKRIIMINNLIDDYLSGKRLSATDERQIFTYLSSDYVDELFNNKIEKIIAKIMDKSEITFPEAEFVCRYFNRIQSRKYGCEEAFLYLDERIIQLNAQGEIKYFDDEMNGCSYGGTIYINDESRKNKRDFVCRLDLMSFIEATYHESLHQKQKSDYNSNIFSAENMAYVIHLLLFDNEDSYIINYSFDPIELQAFKKGRLEKKELLKQYGENIDYAEKRVYISILKEAYAMHLDDKRESPVAQDVFIVQELIKKCHESPDIIEKYKILKFFFNANGTIKSLGKLIESYKSGEITHKYIFFPFFKYVVEHYSIDESELKSATDIVIFNHIFENICYNELEKIDIMIKGYDEFQEIRKKYLQSRDKRYEDYSISLPEGKIKFGFLPNDLIASRVSRVKKYAELIQDETKAEAILDKLDNVLRLKKERKIS